MSYLVAQVNGKMRQDIVSNLIIELMKYDDKIKIQ